MTTIADLPTPALLLDLGKLEANIGGMAEKCRRLGVSLRPHVKTHKSPRVGRMQLEAGARGITVATLHEARRFADSGFDDITWAFPIPLSRVSEAAELSGRVTLRVTVDSVEAIEALERLPDRFKVMLKVDCGYHRSGVDPSLPAARDLARRLVDSRAIDFEGILTHSGQSYSAHGTEELRAVAELERDVMAGFASSLRADGIEVPTVSVGSTPAMSAVQDLEGIDEARPGNYVFYDGMQAAIGSCAVSDCAVTVLTSVVSSARRHSILDAGALALSKDPGRSEGHQPSYGCGFYDYERGAIDPRLCVFSVSQEHGWLTGSHPVGTRIRLLPQHSCLTVALFDEYVVVRGDKVLARWPILRGRD